MMAQSGDGILEKALLLLDLLKDILKLLELLLFHQMENMLFLDLMTKLFVFGKLVEIALLNLGHLRKISIQLFL